MSLMPPDRYKDTAKIFSALSTDAVSEDDVDDDSDD